MDRGRAIVVDVKAAGTAHQNLYDLKYYQRAGVVTAAMQDFSIRDLMARNSRPVADVSVRCAPIVRQAELHRYRLLVSVANTGNVTLEKWWLDLEVPRRVLRDRRNDHFDIMRGHRLLGLMVREISADRGSTSRISFGHPFFQGERFILHPGQLISFDSAASRFPEFIIEIDTSDYHALCDTSVPLSWTLYLNNAAPMHGEVAFEQWCTF